MVFISALIKYGSFCASHIANGSWRSFARTRKRRKADGSRPKTCMVGWLPQKRAARPSDEEFTVLMQHFHEYDMLRAS
jgi:hypothetical protein